MQHHPEYFNLHSTWRFLRDEGGLDIDTFAQRLQLNRAELDGDILTLTRHQLFEMWRMMVERAGEQSIIFAVRDLMLKGRFDTVFYAAVCSRDLRSGLQRLSQSKETLFPLRLPITESKEDLSIRFDWFCDHSAVPDGFVLAEIIVFVAMARFATGHPIVPKQASLYRLPEQPLPYEEWLGISLTQSDSPCVRFHTADLDRPFETCNLEILKLLDADLAHRLAANRAEISLERSVKRCITLRLASGHFDIAAVALALNESVRGLQRKLHMQGTSYQQLLFQARAEMVKEYLKAKLPPAEIALLLGFGEVNSLRRFMQRCKAE